jgi:hypothetical protein
MPHQGQQPVRVSDTSLTDGRGDSIASEECGFSGYALFELIAEIMVDMDLRPDANDDP